MATTEPIRSKEDFRAIAQFFLEKGQYRNYVMVVLGAYTALRVSDLLRLKWQDVYDEAKQSYYRHLAITEQKTGKHKIIALNDAAISALELYYPHRSGKFIFQSRSGSSHITRNQAWRIISSAAKEVGVDGHIACHSLRKTFGYHCWVNGISPVVIMDIYNHSSYNVTKRYLGIAQDDIDEAYLGMELL